MKKLLIAAASLAALSGGIVYAQSQSDDTPSEARVSEEEAAQNPPDPRIIAEDLRAKARRIPRRNLAAALRAASDERDDRARTITRRPNLEALREDLRRTEAEDEERNVSAIRDLSSQTFAAAPREAAPPPPPGIRAVSAERLRTADAEEVARAQIPVLLPAELRDRMKVYGMENVYTATARIDAEARLLISGTCNRVVGGDPDVVAFRKRIAQQPRRLEGTRASYQMSRNDFGVDLSFSKFGCGYVMTVECGDPGADPRCAADDYVTGLAQSMILANPELAGGE